MTIPSRGLRRLSRTLIALVSITMLAGCPGESADTAEPAVAPSKPAPAAKPPPAPKPAPAPAPEPAVADTPAIVDDGSRVKVSLTGNNMLQFNLNEIRVKEGRTIELTLTHVGSGSADTMGHNFVLLAPGTDVTQFGLAAANARDSGFIPPDQAAAVLANTRVLAGGESVTIEFPAPPPGSYDYICSFTGHFGTMRGKLIVE